MQKYLIIIPTYNEIHNVPQLINDLNFNDFDISLLFIDDSSPDGTGNLIDSYIKNSNDKIYVIHRNSKLGVGSAHLEGLKWAFNNGWVNVITIDADGSHRPEDVRKLILIKNKSNVIVCSRWISKDSLPNWSFQRKLITKLGHFLTKHLLKLPYDATNAFRYYKLNNNILNIFDDIKSNGYSFFYESLFLLSNHKIQISEIPISLPARTYGNSKMNIFDMINGLIFLFILFFKKLFILNKNDKNFSIADTSEIDWDNYWNGKKDNGKGIYDFIASIYRIVLIKPALNYFISKYIKNGSSLLHAGCGSGMVDVDIEKNYSLVGLDISRNALDIYCRNHSTEVKTIHGSIFNIPLTHGQFDGIFNLGVMEHFNESEIIQILKSFYSSLNRNGILILFWPPSYGIATKFLKFIHIFFRIFKIKIKLHPDEITYADSHDQIEFYLNKTGFNLINFYFGYKDFYTHRIIIAKKIS